MKLLPLIAATAAILSSAAMADDQILQQRLACQQAQNSNALLSTTIAVSANQQGVGGQCAMQNGDCGASHVELRSTPHGQVYTAIVAGQ